MDAAQREIKEWARALVEDLSERYRMTLEVLDWGEAARDEGLPLLIRACGHLRPLYVPCDLLAAYSNEPAARTAIQESVQKQLAELIYQNLFKPGSHPARSSRASAKPSGAPATSIEKSGKVLEAQECFHCRRKSVREGRCILCGHIALDKLVDELPANAVAALISGYRRPGPATLALRQAARVVATGAALYFTLGLVSLFLPWQVPFFWEVLLMSVFSLPFVIPGVIYYRITRAAIIED